jgi:inorganic pyrophosphatase
MVRKQHGIQRHHPDEVPEVTVVIEIPRGSFLKRGSSGRVDFVSPLPCPFNYGAVDTLIGLEGDLLDAVVLGPRLPRGTRVTVRAYGAVGLTDRGMYDDKLICSQHPIGASQKALVLAFFRFYAVCKHLLNLIRGQAGRNACEGWANSTDAIARASPRIDNDWKGPSISF